MIMDSSWYYCDTSDWNTYLWSIVDLHETSYPLALIHAHNQYRKLLLSFVSVRNKVQEVVRQRLRQNKILGRKKKQNTKHSTL